MTELIVKGCGRMGDIVHKLQFTEYAYEGISINCACYNWSPDFPLEEPYTLEQLLIQYQDHVDNYIPPMQWDREHVADVWKNINTGLSKLVCRCGWETTLPENIADSRDEKLMMIMQHHVNAMRFKHD